MTLARLLGVLGASGGLGASTLAALLAARFTATRGRGLCVDAAPYGGGLDVVLGLDGEPGVRWPDLLRAGGTEAASALVASLPAGLPRAADTPVLAFDRDSPCAPAAPAWDAVLDRLRRCADLVVVDLPAPGDAALPELLSCLDDVVLLVGDTPTALASAAVVHAGLDDHVDRWWLAQRAGPGAGDLPHAVSLALDVPLALAWPVDVRVAADLAHGAPPAGRGRAADAVEDALTVLVGPVPTRRARRRGTGPRQLGSGRGRGAERRALTAVGRTA